MFCCCANDDGQAIESLEPTALFEEKELKSDEVKEAPAKENPPAQPPAPPPAKEEKSREEKAKPVEPPSPAPKPVKEEEAPKPVAEKTKSYHYDIELFKGTGGLGLKMDFKQSGLSVAEIVTGAGADRYNASAAPTRTIEVLDYICAVNGTTGSPQELVAAMKAVQELKVKMYRPASFNVILKKGTGNLGIGLKFQQDSASLDVAEITAGVAQDYNASASAEEQIMVNDVIKSVNGISRDVQKMINEIKAASHLNLVMLRGPA